MREVRHNHNCRCGAVHRLILKLKIRCQADNDAEIDIPLAYQEQEGGIESTERSEGVKLEIMRNDLPNYERALGGRLTWICKVERIWILRRPRRVFVMDRWLFSC